MLDIHCHILPGVDDGAGTLADAVDMARMACQGGISGIIATPHAPIFLQRDNRWSEDMSGRLCSLQGRLDELKIGITLYPGQELYLGGDFHEFVRTLEDGHLIGLNRSRYLLAELDARETLRAACEKINVLCALGYVPIAAHPERYGFALEDEDAVLRLKRAGCLVQLDRGSLLGRFGRRAGECAHALMKRRLADFVASDAHSPYLRTPRLCDIHELICEEYSYEYAHILLEVNPSRVIADQAIDAGNE